LTALAAEARRRAAAELRAVVLEWAVRRGPLVAEAVAELRGTG
jgi:hypothetical protein